MRGIEDRLTLLLGVTAASVNLRTAMPLLSVIEDRLGEAAEAYPAIRNQLDVAALSLLDAAEAVDRALTTLTRDIDAGKPGIPQ